MCPLQPVLQGRGAEMVIPYGVEYTEAWVQQCRSSGSIPYRHMDIVGQTQKTCGENEQKIMCEKG